MYFDAIKPFYFDIHIQVKHKQKKLDNVDNFI